MPTYEYECPKCGHHFEQFQTMSAAPLKKCPACGKSGVKRLIGRGGGLIFKGTGFYVTDYKKTSSSSAEGGDSKPAAPASEPKPAAAAGDAKPAPAKPSPKGKS